MNLSVILVNYNGIEYIKDCLVSIEKCCANIDYEIIVYDNNSKDGSPEFIGSEFPAVKLIKGDVNVGFAKGNNLAIAQAKFNNLLLVNVDTILNSELESVVSIIDENDNIGALTIKMNDSKGNWVVSFGDFPTPRGLIRIGNHFEKKDLIPYENRINQYKVDWISGSFLMTKKDIYERVGGLDEQFFMYVEDVDYSKKISDLGYDLVLFSTASYIHFVGFNSTREKLLLDSYMKYAKKHFSGFSLFIAFINLKINYLYKKLIKKTI